MNQFLRVSHQGRFDFIFLNSHFAEIIAAQGVPPVSLTPVAKGKKSSIRKFLIIFWDIFG
jgi:hypothetical protein